MYKKTGLLIIPLSALLSPLSPLRKVICSPDLRST